MNAFEKVLVNNRVRGTMLRRLTGSLFASGCAPLEGKCILEIGCGHGAGTESMLRASGVHKVFAFDYDPAQVALARRRHERRGAVGASFFIGDAETLPFADEQFDVVVEFAILHHLTDWRRALCEVSRVLKRGGVFVYEDYLEGIVGHPVTERLMVHPRSGIFRAEDFYDGLEEAGLERNPGDRRLRQLWIAGTAARA